MTTDAFWEKPLNELTDSEWESLCDGCGRCCLKKIEDEADRQIYWTRVICRYFDEQDHRCTCYKERSTLVPDCLNVRQMRIEENMHWMPETCSYRLRAEGKALPDWHPLLTGGKEAMQAAGISVGGQVLSEDYVHPGGQHEHIIQWVKS
mgnify:CR=1 FL=1